MVEAFTPDHVHQLVAPSRAFQAARPRAEISDTSAAGERPGLQRVPQVRQDRGPLLVALGSRVYLIEGAQGVAKMLGRLEERGPLDRAGGRRAPVLERPLVLSGRRRVVGDQLRRRFAGGR